MDDNIIPRRYTRIYDRNNRLCLFSNQSGIKHSQYLVRDSHKVPHIRNFYKPLMDENAALYNHINDNKKLLFLLVSVAY